MVPFGSKVARLSCESTNLLFSFMTCQKEIWGISFIISLIFLLMLLNRVSVGKVPLIILLMVFMESSMMIICWIWFSLASWTHWRRVYSYAWLLELFPKLQVKLASISPLNQEWPLPHLPPPYMWDLIHYFFLKLIMKNIYNSFLY